MIRFKLCLLLFPICCTLIFACKDEDEQKGIDKVLAAPLPELKEKAIGNSGEGMIELDHAYLLRLPDSLKFNPQKEGFAFLINYEIAMVQALLETGRRLNFLDHREKKIYTAKSLENRQLVEELFIHEVTTTDLDTSLKPSLVYVGEKADPKWISLKEINDPDKISNLKERISLKDTYSDEFEAYGGPLGGILRILSDDPSVWEFRFQDKKHHIVTYHIYDAENTGYSADAATFLLSPTKIFPLTGPCSFDKFPVLFLMNKKLYLQGGSSCCDCGIIVDQLFEYDGEKLKAILEDGSWST